MHTAVTFESVHIRNLQIYAYLWCRPSVFIMILSIIDTGMFKSQNDFCSAGNSFGCIWMYQ